MTTHVQHNQLVPNQAEMNLPRPSMVAAIAGTVLAGLLFLSSLPLLAAGGLWLLGLALVLIAYVAWMVLGTAVGLQEDMKAMDGE